MGIPAARALPVEEFRNDDLTVDRDAGSARAYRVEWSRDQTDPQPLPYLDSDETRQSGAIDIQMEVWLESGNMRRAGQPAARLSHTTFRHAYWTIAQMVTHHSVNGCLLQPGDLLGSGTESGPTPPEAGSLLELSAGGKQPITLPNGEKRSFLEATTPSSSVDGVKRRTARESGLAIVAASFCPHAHFDGPGIFGNSGTEVDVQTGQRLNVARIAQRARVDRREADAFD